MSLSAEIVARTVKGWSMIFPGVRTNEELAFISAKYCKSLAPSFNDHTFQIAAELVERETEFFPTIKAILNVRDSAYRIRQKTIESKACALLPEETKLTPEEEQVNLKKLEIIKKMLIGELSMDDAVTEQEKIKHYSIG